MTERQKRVLRGLMAGRSYVDIAHDMGITRQAAYDLAKKAIRHGGDYTDGYYPNIRNYISENCEDMADFAERAGVNYRLVQEMLKHGRSPRWSDIVKMAAYTGMDLRTLMVMEPAKNVQA